MDFVRAATGASGAAHGLSSDHGPILYSEPNRTSAIEDIRSVIIYISFATLLLAFLIILPGIRHDKLPTFLCISTSLVVTCIILAALMGTSWHVAEAPISAAYKAFSKDRIQGQLSVKIGLQSVNITLGAHKYFIEHQTRGPMMMDHLAAHSSLAFAFALEPSGGEPNATSAPLAKPNLGLGEAAFALDAEPDADEPFAIAFDESARDRPQSEARRQRKRSTQSTQRAGSTSVPIKGQRYIIKRVNVDINYNERFYWIEPNQMRQEHQQALERGLPYPILTVVEYLSQDDAGFNWSRQYRLAGYYSYILLSLSLCACILMFLFHCAAPEYAIYTLQIIGCLLLFTNFTYAMLVPRGDQKLVIPFEGQSLTFDFGFDFWLVLTGGCLSISVGTLISIVNTSSPNFTLTTILDADFDANHGYYKHRKRQRQRHQPELSGAASERPKRPHFVEDKPPSPPASPVAPSQQHSAASNRSARVAAERSRLLRPTADPNQAQLSKCETQFSSQASAATRPIEHTEKTPSNRRSKIGHRLGGEELDDMSRVPHQSGTSTTSINIFNSDQRTKNLKAKEDQLRQLLKQSQKSNADMETTSEGSQIASSSHL